MAINVTLGEVKTQELKKFPKLMIGLEGSIVLFFKSGKGTMLCDTNPQKPRLIGIGEYYDGWDMGAFTDYNEPITLQNI